MLLTGRMIAALVTVALASGGAAWGVHTMISPSGSGSDFGLDTNGNGKFDFLVVEASVVLPDAGTWDVSASLSAKSAPSAGTCGFGGRGPPMILLPEVDAPYPIAWTYERYFFPAGAQTVRMAFPGTDIARAGIDGPFVVQARLSLGGIVLGEPRMNMPEPVDGIAWDYTTSAYSVGAFEEPIRPATFTGQHDDSAIDIDDDGLADFLELRAAVHVDVAGPYSLSGFLSSNAGSDRADFVVYAYRHFELQSGDAGVFLRFPGDQIRQANVDGPWNFTLTLHGALAYPADGGRPGELIWAPTPFYPENLCGKTSAYRASEFDDTVELLRYTGRFHEATPDRNGDGTHDALVITAEVEVFVTSAFDLAGVLRPMTGTAELAHTAGQVWLHEGLQTAEFAFGGPEIRRAGVDGPYVATLSITPAVRGIDPTTTYTTRAYRAADFDAQPANGTHLYWIGDLEASVRASSLAISTRVVRGPDMLAIVIEDVLTVTVADAAGTVVGTFKDRVYLPTGGASQSFVHTLDRIASGTYTITAVLGDPNHPVDVRTLSVTV